MSMRWWWEKKDSNPQISKHKTRKERRERNNNHGWRIMHSSLLASNPFSQFYLFPPLCLLCPLVLPWLEPVPVPVLLQLLGLVYSCSVTIEGIKIGLVGCGWKGYRGLWSSFRSYFDIPIVFGRRSSFLRSIWVGPGSSSSWCHDTHTSTFFFFQATTSSEILCKEGVARFCCCCRVRGEG